MALLKLFTMKNLLFVLFAILAIGFASCGGSDCSLENAAADGDAYLVLGNAYAADSTMANCEAYKVALESFVSDYDGCDDVTITAQVAATNAVLSTLDCQ